MYKDKERNCVLINFLLQFTRPADTCEIALVTVMSFQKRCYIINTICCTTENLIYGMQQSYLMTLHSILYILDKQLDIYEDTCCL